jgi:hypothetical protein
MGTVTTNHGGYIEKCSCVNARWLPSKKIGIRLSSGIFWRSRRIPLPEPASLTNLSGFVSDAG